MTTAAPTRWSKRSHRHHADQREAVRLLRRVATGQRGRASTAQAARVGCGPDTLATLHRRGEVTRPRQGVVRFSGAPDDEGARDWETVLAAGADPTTAGVLEERAAERAAAGLPPNVLAGPAGSSPEAAASFSSFSARPAAGVGSLDPPGQDVVLCMGTALRALGVSRARPFDHNDVLVKGTSAPDIPWARVHRTRQLDPCDVTLAGGVPVTSGARSLFDLSRHLDREDVLALTDDVVCARLATRGWLHRRARALLPGRPQLRRIIEVTGPEGEGVFHSWLERQGARLLKRAGLPRPEWQVPISDDHGFIGVVDARWCRPDSGRDVIWELEGLRFHTTPTQRRKDADRFNRLTLAHVVVRHTWEDVVRDPARVIADLRHRLAHP